jgi:KipI family sensor histidine kinase inhibitor
VIDEERPAIQPFGDAALLVVLGDRLDLEVAGRAHALAAVIGAATAGLPGWGSPVPAAASVLVTVDPIVPGVAAAEPLLREIIERVAGEPAAAAPGGARPTLEVRVRYGGADGPDLDEVAALCGLSPGAVIEAHASVEYRVLFLGFAPGFGYLGLVPDAIVVPRRATPRTRVPAGSVALAGAMTAVYPLPSPGGWQLIGRTDAVLWEPGRAEPASLRAGDSVRFVPDGR